MDIWLDDAVPTEGPVIDWDAVRRERKRRGWVHWTAGGSVATEGGFAWIVMTHAATGAPQYAKFRATCGHLLDFDTARCTACGEPFPRPGVAYGIGIVVQYLTQGEALYHEACAPEKWLRPFQVPISEPPAATQARLF